MGFNNTVLPGVRKLIKMISRTGAAAAALVLVLFIGFFCVSGTAFAADYASEYSGIVYNLDNKLGSSEVNAVTQIDNGYIWIGTYTGLYQFDGNMFTKLELDDRIHSIMTMLPNGHDGIWLGTNDAGLVYYSFETKETKFYSTADGLGADSVRALCYGKSGELYIGTNSYLSVLDADGTLTTYSGSDDLYYIRGITCRADGTVACVSNGGKVFILKDEVISQSFEREEADASYSAVKFLSNGNLVIGSTDGILYSGTLEGNKYKVSRLKDTDDIGMTSVIFENSEGRVIIGGDKGMGYLDRNLRFIVVNRQDFNNSVCDVFEDYQGNLWVASSRQGILKLSKNPFTNIFSIAGVSDKVVNSVIASGERLYIGCDDGLIMLNKGTYHREFDSALSFLDGVRIRNIMEDSKGNLWFSTYSTYGLVKFDGERARCFTENEDGVRGSKIRLSIELSNGDILAGSSTGLTFIRNDEVISTIGAKEGLEVEQILCLWETKDGLVYAGSDGDGVYVIKDGKIVDNIGADEGLGGLVVLRIVQNDKYTFFATGNELYIYEDGKCRALYNFPHSNNFDIMFSSDNKAWITSSAGIYIVGVDDLAKDTDYIADLLNSARGLNTTMVANSWNYKDANDYVYLCCSTGVKLIRMTGYSLVNNDFEVDIRQVSLDGNPIEPDENGVYHITSDARRVSFTPAVLNYSLSNPYVKMYLEGFENDGVILGQSELKEVSYTNLSFGNYVFHIQVLDNYMKVVKEDTITLHKDAMIYERSIFWIGSSFVAVLVIMAITWALTERRNGRIIKEQYMLIEKAKEEAERISEYKTLFLANMSHEIRTPINTIMGMDELILRENIPSQVRRYANDIYVSGDSLLNIVNDILDLSKIESGKMNILPVEYNLAEELRELGNALRVKADEAKLEIIIDFDPNLPSKLYGDNNRIKQVITNLLTNAVKYTEKGSVTFKAELLDMNGEFADIRVSVIDTGIGIKKEDMDKLFEEFERLDEERNRSVKGTGLGLPITKQLLELMGSKLEVQSVYEEGSNFSFVIRQRVISAEKIGKIDLSAIADAGFASYKPSFIAPDVNILVVDDTPLNLVVIKGLLKSTKVHIDTGESGLVALELVKQNKYDLIMLDHMMPEMDGIETLEQLGKINHKCMGVPVIVLTANAIAGAKESYIKLGFTDYLSKPVSGKDLENMLMKYLPPSKVFKKAEEVNTGEVAESSANSEIADTEADKPLIDKVKGIGFCAGDEDLYKSVLSMFADEYKKEPAEIKKYIDLRDAKKFTTHAHKLKSSARTIGADSLFEMAKDFEAEGKAENWDAIKEKYAPVMELYGIVVEETEKIM